MLMIVPGLALFYGGLVRAKNILSVLMQMLGVGLTLAWSGLAALIAFLMAKRTFGLRVDHDAEREGLDISAHGESAYEN